MGRSTMGDLHSLCASYWTRFKIFDNFVYYYEAILVEIAMMSLIVFDSNYNCTFLFWGTTVNAHECTRAHRMRHACKIYWLHAMWHASDMHVNNQNLQPDISEKVALGPPRIGHILQEQIHQLQKLISLLNCCAGLSSLSLPVQTSSIVRSIWPTMLQGNRKACPDLHECMKLQESRLIQ